MNNSVTNAHTIPRRVNEKIQNRMSTSMEITLSLINQNRDLTIIVHRWSLITTISFTN